MDLPPDKAKLLKNYDDEKKWELVCDQVCIQQSYQLKNKDLLTFIQYCGRIVLVFYPSMPSENRPACFCLSKRRKWLLLGYIFHFQCFL